MLQIANAFFKLFVLTAVGELALGRPLTAARELTRRTLLLSMLLLFKARGLSSARRG